MENPSVNPVYGGNGRTEAQRRQELELFKNTTRASAGNGVDPAIFQGDYLFVQLAPNSPVQLHRVAHGACIADATAPDILITTLEYVHTPQEGFSGFFGTFAPKANPQYDPRNAKKTGGKHLRHKNVDRSCIKMYNVATFSERKRSVNLLRVTLHSLVMLADSCDGYELPPNIPRTHGALPVVDSSDEEVLGVEFAPQAQRAQQAAPPKRAQPSRAARNKRSRDEADDHSSEGSEPSESPPQPPSRAPSDESGSNGGVPSPRALGDEFDDAADEEDSQIFAADSAATAHSAEPALEETNAIGRDVLVPASEWKDSAPGDRPDFVGWKGTIMRIQKKHRNKYFMVQVDGHIFPWTLEALKQFKMIS